MSGKRQPKVLTFHTVLPSRPDNALFFYAQPTAAEFEDQIRYLATHCRPLSLDEYLQIVAGKISSPRDAVLVTLDDGYKLSELAAEILRRHRVPSVLFLAVDYIGAHRWPWYLTLDWLIERSGLDEVDWRDQLFLLTHLAERKIFRDRFKDLYLAAPTEERVPMLQELAAALGGELPDGRAPDTHRFLNWQEAAALGCDGYLELGSHGLSHHDMTRLDDNTLAREMDDSSAAIEKNTGVRPRVLSYPDGRHDARVRDAAAQTYEASFALLAGASFEDPMCLPRLPAVPGGEWAVRRSLSRSYPLRHAFWNWRARRGWI